jgi:hypothetical protein
VSQKIGSVGIFFQLEKNSQVERNVLPYGQDTALGLVKWYFNGQELGFEVQNIQEEYRFPYEKANSDVLFTVQWAFLGQGHYGGNL